MVRYLLLIGSDEEGLILEKNGETWGGVRDISSLVGGFSSW